MLLTLNKPRLLTLPKSIDFFFIVTFLYFFTLHADLLHLRIGGFALRLNNLFGMMLFTAMMLRYRKAFFMIRKEVAIPLLIMTFFVTLALICSPYKRRCTLFFIFYLFTVLVYFWLPYQMLLRFPLERVLKSYFLSFICVGLIAIGQLPRFVHSLFTIRPDAYCYEPSYYALYMTPFVVMITYHHFINRDSTFYVTRRSSWLLFFYVHFVFMLSCTSTAFLLYLFLMATLLLFAFKSEFAAYRQKILTFLLSITACFGVLTAIFQEYVMALMLKVLSPSYFLYHHSFRNRWMAAQAAWRAFCEHPLTGVGLGGFPVYRYERWLAHDANYPHHKSEAFILNHPSPEYLFEAANVLSEFFASIGVGGIITSIAFSVSFILLAKKSLRHAFHWTWAFILSTVLLILSLQVKGGLLRTYIWVHVALAFAFFVRSLSAAKKA